MRLDWAPSCNFRGPFFQERGSRKRYLNLFVQTLLLENGHLLSYLLNYHLYRLSFIKLSFTELKQQQQQTDLC